MISDDSVFRDYVNSLDTSVEGEDAPPISETINDTPAKVKKDQEFFVQKIITEVYVYTDLENQKYGEMSFQNVEVLGTIPAEKMLRMFRRKRRQQERDS